jgi:hypothetical protein
MSSLYPSLSYCTENLESIYRLFTIMKGGLGISHDREVAPLYIVLCSMPVSPYSDSVTI